MSHHSVKIAIFDTPEQISVFRLLTLKSALKLEIRGIRVRRGFSAYSAVKRQFGIKGDRASVLKQLEDIISLHMPKTGQSN